jgi:endosialidase-like protein
MKIKNLYIFVLFLLCTLSFHQVEAQLVQDVSITAEEANFQMIAPNSYLLEIGSSNGYYFKEEIDHTNNISIGNVRADGKKFPDGTYTMQVTPILTLSESERIEISALREAKDFEKMAAFRAAHNLPDQVDVYNIYFSIRNGQFVTPEQKETKGLNLPTMSGVWQQDHPALYASLNNVSVEYGQPIGIKDRMPSTDNTVADDDQVFVDEVIIIGSLCVGVDCVNGENFGFDTQRLKENNLRIHFDDTSSSGSFPANDWRITINDSSNGGASYFAVEDATAGRVPFRIIAGAPANSLYVDAQGDIGVGTANPIVEMHVTDGDSPTLRLEQDGSAGFTPQTWDIAGNETNFFVRDVTNGSKLPFKIRPGAPDNSIYIQGSSAPGNIGLGTANPSHKLQVESGNIYVKSGKVGVNVVPTVALDVVGNSKFKGASIFQGDPSFFLTNGTSFLNALYTTVLRIDATNARIGIGTSAPGHQLELSQDDAAKPNGGSWTAASDRRLKTNIIDFNDGLETILKIHPVSYNYNGKLGYPTEKTFIGVIAQEMRDIAPYTVKKLNKPAPEGEEDYLAFDGTPVTYLLINAVQEQQEMIDAQKVEIERLKSELAGVQDLKAQVAALAEMVSSLNKSTDDSSEEVIGEKE